MQKGIIGKKIGMTQLFDEKGMVVPVTVIEVEPNTELMEAQNIPIKLLDEFSEDHKHYYDFNFTLKKEESETVEGFIIEGARNSSGNGLSWNNNREVEEPTGE